jgi:HEAT repeat protein
VTDDPRVPPAASADDEEADTETPRRGTAIRFFLLPLLVVGTAVVIFFVFNLMTFERRSPADYLQEVRGGSANRRWQAAFELSREVARVPPGPERQALAAETLRVFQGLSTRRPEDVLVRRYLVLVLGKLQERTAVPALLAAVKDPDSETRLYAVWALGRIGDRSALPAIVEGSFSDDSGARKMAAYVLGRLGDARAIPRLQVLLEDPVADVRWNAAIALATLGDRSGVLTLRSIVDRQSLSRQATLTADQAEIAIVNALKALAALRDPESLPLLERVAREDPNLQVRQAARDAIAATRQSAPSTGVSPAANLERPDTLLVG